MSPRSARSRPRLPGESRTGGRGRKGTMPAPPRGEALGGAGQGAPGADGPEKPGRPKSGLLKSGPAKSGLA